MLVTSSLVIVKTRKRYLMISDSHTITYGFIYCMNQSIIMKHRQWMVKTKSTVFLFPLFLKGVSKLLLLSLRIGSCGKNMRQQNKITVINATWLRYTSWESQWIQEMSTYWFWKSNAGKRNLQHYLIAQKLYLIHRNYSEFVKSE